MPPAGVGGGGGTVPGVVDAVMSFMGVEGVASCDCLLNDVLAPFSRAAKLCPTDRERGGEREGGERGRERGEEREGKGERGGGGEGGGEIAQSTQSQSRNTRCVLQTLSLWPDISWLEGSTLSGLPSLLQLQQGTQCSPPVPCPLHHSTTLPHTLCALHHSTTLPHTPYGRVLKNICWNEATELDECKHTHTSFKRVLLEGASCQAVKFSLCLLREQLTDMVEQLHLCWITQQHLQALN